MRKAIGMMLETFKSDVSPEQAERFVLSNRKWYVEVIDNIHGQLRVITNEGCIALIKYLERQSEKTCELLDKAFCTKDCTECNNKKLCIDFGCICENDFDCDSCIIMTGYQLIHRKDVK